VTGGDSPTNNPGELGVSGLVGETRQWPLRRQLFVGMAILSVILSFGAGRSISYFEKRFLTESVNRYGQNTLNILRSSAIEAIISEDQPILLSFANQLLKRDQKIQQVIFRNEGREIIASAKRQNSGKTKARAEDISRLRADITHLGETFGTVELVIDLSAENRAIERHSLLIAGLVAFVLISLTVLIFIGLTFSVLRPLAMLDRRIRACAEGFFMDRAVSLPLQSKELGRLGRSVELLGQSLRLNHLRTGELVAAKEAAEQANKAKSEFLSGMSHELRTPLNAVVGFSEMMRSQLMGPLGNERYKEYAEHIYNAGNHLVSLVSDVLDLAKIEAGKFVIEEEVVDLETLIRDTVRLISDSAEQKGLKVSLFLVPGVGVIGDSRRLRQILLNLLSNSIKFTDKDGHVEVITVEEEDGSLVLTVGDSGVGISPDQIGRVLEPFGQVRDSSYEAAEGTGLGLPIAKNLAAMHDALFEIHSEPGKGTDIRIVFPPERVVAVQSEGQVQMSVNGPS